TPADPASGAVDPAAAADKNAVASSRLVVRGYQVRGKKIRAGKRFRARMVVRRKAGAPGARRLAVRCPAVLAGERSVNVVRSKLRRLGNGRIKATCVWKVPQGTAGSKLEAAVVVGTGRDSARIAFAARVRQA
ncbi:MAG: hypothetical protein ACR2OD_03235, partial [Gaiellaceae bacterium]